MLPPHFHNSKTNGQTQKRWVYWKSSKGMRWMQADEINSLSWLLQVSFKTSICKYISVFRACYQRQHAAKKQTPEYIESYQRECVECKQVKLIRARGCCT
jgi:hypothetical protein